MTLTQCSAMASAEQHLSWEIAGVVVVDVGASTSSALRDRLVSNATTRRGRGKSRLSARGWYFSTLSTLCTATDVDEPSAQDRWDLKLVGGRERGKSIIELNLRSDRDRDTFLLTFARECSNEITFELDKSLKILCSQYEFFIC